ncbi:MAG: hypothetical protein ACI808_000572 [Paraglaciecola sp.]
MQINFTHLIGILLGLSIIAVLAFYAISLLLKLNKQKQLQNQKRQQRVIVITQSIQTISMALEQQQCNLSEGCIRLYNLLECIPIDNRPDYSQHYPALYGLYEKVKDLATHDDRKQLKSSELRRQDEQREEDESQWESKILVEVGQLKNFSI